MVVLQLVDYVGIILTIVALAAVLPERASRVVTLSGITAMLIFTVILPRGSVYSYEGLGLVQVVEGYKAAGILLLTLELLVLLSFIRDIDRRNGPLLILMSAGSLLVLYSESFITLIVGLETAAVALAALYSVGEDRATEAAIKYFYSSMLGVAFIVLAAALFYNNGIHDFSELDSNVNILNSHTNLLLGLVFLVAGLSLEAGLAPFYMWLPDVVEGAGLLSVAVALLLLDASVTLKLLHLIASVGTATSITLIMLVMAVASMFIGEFSALAQNGVRRMLGYSIVGGAGYKVILALALALAGRSTLTPIVYLVTASSMSVALVVASQYYQDTPCGKIAEVVGLLSMAGIPPLYGFAAKLIMLMTIISAGCIWIALATIAFFLVAASYIIRYMLSSSFKVKKNSSLESIPLVIYAVLVFVLGIWPQVIDVLEVINIG
ncbi:MAG: proton-conducting transporter membrane subunit [Desulfurococcus sp.]|nr:proton-conducting transporter membrane subunit [Desulfurococcus sp.]